MLRDCDVANCHKCQKHYSEPTLIAFVHLIITFNLLSFGDVAVKSPYVLHCDESPNDVTMKLSGDSPVTVVGRLHCEVTMTVTLGKVTS